jgi:hypothetical protein
MDEDEVGGGNLAFFSFSSCTLSKIHLSWLAIFIMALYLFAIFFLLVEKCLNV